MSGLPLTETLQRRMKRLGIAESDLEEKFVRSGGAGGQHVNKVSTCVLLTHRPSGKQIRSEAERSQNQNRIRARELLVEWMERREREEKERARFLAEKKRRQHRGRSKKAKRRMLENKRHRSEIKKSRGTVKNWD